MGERESGDGTERWKWRDEGWDYHQLLISNLCPPLNGVGRGAHEDGVCELERVGCRDLLFLWCLD